MPDQDSQDAAAGALLAALAARGYRFITPTNSTVRAVRRRARARAPTGLRDVFGWSLPFAADAIDPELIALMDHAGVLARRGDRLGSRVRVSSIAGSLFMHSAYPPRGRRAVFLGPDSYRFAAFIAEALQGLAPLGPIVDIGAGSGVGGVVAARAWPGARLVLADINPQALRLARINAAFAGTPAETVRSDALSAVAGEIGLALANPPYLFSLPGLPGRLYRDGGGRRGAQLSLAWARAAAARLRPGGRLLLYTGSAIIAGRDPLKEALAPALEAAGCDLSYREIDPDVFGGLLAHPAYWGVERIAAVAVTAVRH